MSKTKLEKLSYSEISKLPKSELKSTVKRGLKASFNRIDRLVEKGYGISDYNRTFMSVVGKDYGSAVDDMGDTVNELRSTASYLKRHLESDNSSVAGMRRKEVNSLKTITKLAGDDNPSIKRVKGGYRMNGSLITQNDISEFWEIVRKVDEDHTMQTLKEGSGEGVAKVAEMVFDMKEKNPIVILQTLKDQYKSEQEERYREEEERERRLEEVRKQRRFRND